MSEIKLKIMIYIVLISFLNNDIRNPRIPPTMPKVIVIVIHLKTIVNNAKKKPPTNDAFVLYLTKDGKTNTIKIKAHITQLILHVAPISFLFTILFRKLIICLMFSIILYPPTQPDFLAIRSSWPRHASHQYSIV